MRRIPALLATIAAVATSAQAVYQIGDVVDDFTLVDTDGISHSLYDYKGQIIVLNFGEYWCGPCISEWGPMKADFWSPNKDQGVMIFTIGSDVEAAFTDKANQFSGGLDEGGWPWLFDAAGTLYWDYGDGYIPYNSILDQDFRLIYGHSGWAGNFNAMQAEIDANLAETVVHQIEPLIMSASRGDNISLGVTLTRRIAGAQTMTAVLDIILPGHNEYGGNPLQEMTFTLPFDATFSRTLELTVPEVAPLGEYRARIGLIQDGEYNASSLNYITIE